MRAEIRKFLASEEFFTPERCHITEVANDRGDETMSVARARVEPGITTSWHKLMGIEERYIISHGKGIVEVGDLEPQEVKEGDLVRIPAGVRQRITNTGSKDLVFFAVCSPRFTQEKYIDLE